MAGPRKARSRRQGRGAPLDKARALSILFRRKTFASVWCWLERLGVPVHDRNDVQQDVFLAAHHSWHTYNPLRSRPERWLNKITVHVVAHYWDRALHRREAPSPVEIVDIVDEAPGPDDRIIGEQGRMLVLELLQALHVDLRAVLTAHEFDGISMAEFAEQRGIPLSTAYKWRARALVALHEAAEERRREGEPEEDLG